MKFMQYFSVIAVFCLSFVAAQEAASQPQTTNNAPASPPATAEDTQTRFGSLSVSPLLLQPLPLHRNLSPSLLHISH